MRLKGGSIAYVWSVRPMLMKSQLRSHVPMRTSLVFSIIARFAQNLQLRGEAIVAGLDGIKIIQ